MRESDRLSSADEGTGTSRSPRETFAELYERYLPGVFRYVSYRVNDTSVAEDLTSAVFEKAITRLESYHSDKASFSTWLFAIARNTVVDHYRASQRAQTMPLDKVTKMSDPNLSPEEALAKQQERQRLQECLAGLSSQEQDIVSFKFAGELTNRQIASMTSLSESNVGTILYRTVRKLRDCFQRWQNG